MKMESNKAFHPYGAQGAPRVNADVGQKDNMPRKGRIIISTMGLILAPLVLMVAYTTVWRWTPLSNANIDPEGYIGFPIAILGGLIYLWRLPIRAFWKCLLTMAYIPATIYPLLIFQLLFAAVALGVRW